MIKPLTSLRFIFAFMVFASHLSFLEKSRSGTLNWLYNSVLHEGYIGVSFFFILSGFILAYHYQSGILENKKSIKKFYLARFARIFPLHLLTLIISLPFSYGIFVEDSRLWLCQLVTNLSLTQSYIPLKSIYFSFNAPSWSISDEVFFYLLFPFLILLISKISMLKRWGVLSIVAIVPLLTFVIPEAYYHPIFYINPFLRVVDFIIGIFVFNMYQSFLKNDRRINYTYLEISSVLLLVVFFGLHQSIPGVARYSFYYWIPMCYLIFAFSFQRGKASVFLSNKIGFHLGEISFGFYLFHQLVLRYFLVMNSKFLGIDSDFAIVIIVFSISLVISHYSYVLFERPMNVYIKTFKKAKANTP